jgi:AcrR family transcriptional regulator
MMGAMAPNPLDRATGRRTPGRPATIDRAAIAAAALAEIDGLSLSAVARRLGVAKSTLYHHVDGRDQLVRLAADAALATWQRPDPAVGWEEFTRAFAHAGRDCLLANPGLDLALLELHEAPAAMVETIAWGVDVVGEAGVERATAATAFPVLATFAHDDARHRRARAAWPEDWLDRRVDLVITAMRTTLD